LLSIYFGYWDILLALVLTRGETLQGVVWERQLDKK